ncbi:MAG: hypothetical protein ACR2OA_11930 [Rubripirellula sp.]|jgi:hypothetical protein
MTQSDSIPPEGEPDPTTEAANSDAANSDATSVGRVQPADQADQTQLTQFITTIKNAEEQVGEHIIRALQHADTVAVITTLAIGPDGKQRVISAALNAQRMQQVQEILNSAQQERIEEEPCVGFHCLVETKTAEKEATDSADTEPETGPKNPE